MPSPLRRPRGRLRLLTGAALLGVITTAAAACAPPPPAPQARGIDVSNYQHPGGVPINWGEVRGSGVEFAFIKATEGPVGCGGDYYTNGWFRRDWTESAAAGVFRGAYHFARPGDVASAVNQARYFANTVGNMNGPRDLPPVLDLEQSCGLDAPSLAAFARAWVDEVHHLTGRVPIIYTYYYFWKDQMAGDPSLGHLPLWIATYGPKPMVPAPWGNWTFWQHSSTGAVPGIAGNVDLNWFSHNSEALARFVVEGASNPRGFIDTASGGPGAVSVAGWALDLDDPAPIDVHVFVDGKGVAVTAHGNRPDVGAVFATAGPAHGFNGIVSGVSGGRHEVCVDAINKGPGLNVRLGCRTVDVASVEPIGWLDHVGGGPGQINIGGWALDPDTSEPAPIHVYVDSVNGFTTETGDARPDVADAVPGAGPNRGFNLNVGNIAPGRHDVCVFVINIAGPGHNRLLGCRPANVT
jgi:GH25 family lysozyme M1 (1,4-beta-N-acetylmuramidase)